jgi:UrcA family protein
MNIQTRRTQRPLIARTIIGSLYLSALLVIAPAAVIAGPASAPETASATISLFDLDLTTSSGLSAAQQRLAVAAKRLCNRFADSRKVSDRATAVECYRDTLAKALQRLNVHFATTRAEQSAVAQNVP